MEKVGELEYLKWRVKEEKGKGGRKDKDTSGGRGWRRWKVIAEQVEGHGWSWCHGPVERRNLLLADEWRSSSLRRRKWRSVCKWRRASQP